MWLKGQTYVVAFTFVFILIICNELEIYITSYGFICATSSSLIFFIEMTAARATNMHTFSKSITFLILWVYSTRSLIFTVFIK